MAVPIVTREQVLQVCGQAYGWVQPEECLWLFETASRISPGGTWVEIGLLPGRSFLAAGLGLPRDGRLIGVVDGSGELQQPRIDETYRKNLQGTVDRLRELRPDLQISIVPVESQNTCHSAAAGLIDCVFVEASRNAAWISSQIKCWLTRISPHGCLTGHGLGRPEWPELTRTVVEMLPGVSSGAGSIWSWTAAPLPDATAESPRLSVIVATTGRASLTATLASIRAQRLWPGDEVLLVHDGPAGIQSVIAWDQAQLPGQMIVLPDGPHGDWGAAARSAGQFRSNGSHLVWQDDDDVYLSGAFDVMRREIIRSPDDILLFRLAYPGGRLLWKVPVIQCRNVSTQMYVVPRAAKLGHWGSHYQGDFQFIQTTVAANPDRQVRFVDKPTVMYSR